MATLKITKKHHKHLNNPFTSPPQSGLSIQGKLFFDSETLQLDHTYDMGRDFKLNWSPEDGGFLSVHHKSEPSRDIWSTIPGQAFISAAVAETEVEESRGSFLVKDHNIHLVCNHQTVECIRVVENESDFSFDAKDQFPSNFCEMDEKMEQHGAQFPILIVAGKILSVKKVQDFEEISNLDFLEESSTFTRYWMLFDQKNSNQIGFQVRLGKLNVELNQKVSPITYEKLFRKLSRILRHQNGWTWTGFLSKRKGWLTVSSAEEETVVKKAATSTNFNRIWLIYTSKTNERFYGFGEQFSHMDFKGKRVPILVQEQGIGRGDQPITFAANLFSYRAGGDWSTTYAPSPFYMTSKMRSLYLEGYNYSIFDLTKHDRVQIQVYGDSVQGRILHGNSPIELIEHFTEAIGRQPELPEWIISGAIVGIQGGTDTVRNIWNKLQTYDVPISAFWLQDWVGQRETVIGSQLWWNWEVDPTRYGGWQQLIKDLRAEHISVMTYCNPCLAPMDKKPNVRRNFLEEAKKMDILVKNKIGETYLVPNTAFDVGMLDLTHPSTADWFKQILHNMVDDGVRGWMADFGEGLPVDASVYSGQNTKS